MSITSMLFIFAFFPASLAIYYIAPERIKEYVLLIVSFMFYALGSLDYFLLFILATVVNVAIGRTMANVQANILRRTLLVIGIIANSFLLFYYKYTDFILLTWSNIFKTEAQLKHMALPLGISFFTFKAISYLVDIYKEKARPFQVLCKH